MGVVKNVLLSSYEDIESSSDADEFIESSDEDEFKLTEIKPFKKFRGFNVVKREQYGTTSIYVVDEEKKTKQWEKECTILCLETEYGVQKAIVKLQSPGLVCYFKMWETEINGALELLGFPHVTFVYDNMMYPKTKLIQPQPKNFILKSVFIKEGKTYPKL